MIYDLLHGHYIQARMHKAEGKETENGLLGYGTIILENMLVLKNVRLYQGKRGVFLSFPKKKVPDGGYQAYMHCSRRLQKEILEIALLDLTYQKIGLKIEEIRIKKGKGDILAYATVVFPMGVSVSDIHIQENGIQMPQYGQQDLCYLLGTENREKLKAEILKAYWQWVERGSED